MTSNTMNRYGSEQWDLIHPAIAGWDFHKRVFLDLEGERITGVLEGFYSFTGNPSDDVNCAIVENGKLKRKLVRMTRAFVLEELVAQEYDRIVSLESNEYPKIDRQLVEIAQVKAEITDLIKLIAKRFKGQEKITLLEIGLLRCGNFCLMGNCLSRLGFEVHMIGIDLPNKRHWEKSKTHAKLTVSDMPQVIGCEFTYDLIVGSSQDKTVLEQVNSITNKIDVLFIDGLHTGDWPRKDFNAYKHLVGSGGFVIFHDIHNTPSGTFKVQKVWNSLRNEGSERIEITTHPTKWGIGVIIM